MPMHPNYIKNLRTARGLTQEAVAELIGVTRQTYANIENGTKSMTIEEAQALSKTLNVSFMDFIEGKNIMDNVVINKNKIAASEDTIYELRDSVPQITIDESKYEKFKQLILYILQKVGAKPNVGETVLYKLLYFIDFDYYEKFETQLIGASYTRNHYGPTPVEFATIVNEMIKANELERVSSSYFAYPQVKYLPISKADLSLFTGKEMQHIDEELNRLSDKNATELSDLSHKDVPWITASEGDVLDYEAVFYRTSDTSVRDYDDVEL